MILYTIKSGSKMMRFTCSDQVGEIRVVVHRVEKAKGF
jgi:hypothetical protein